MPENRVTIELSKAQIDRVLREPGGGGLLGLIGGMEAVAGAEEIEFLASLA